MARVIRRLSYRGVNSILLSEAEEAAYGSSYKEFELSRGKLYLGNSIPIWLEL